MLLAGCVGEGGKASIPSDAEIARLDPAALEGRFGGLDARFDRGAAESADVRLAAAHAAFSAFERTRDPAYARRVRRWAGAVIEDEAGGRPRCSAERQLVALELAIGDRQAAGARILTVLSGSVADEACRGALVGEARNLGLAIGAPLTAGGGDARGRVASIEIFGDRSESSAGVRVVVALDVDAPGELFPVVEEEGVRLARLRFPDARVPESIDDRANVGGGLESIRIATDRSGIDFVLEPGATIRGAVVSGPTRFVVDVDRPRDPLPTRGRRSAVVVLDPGHGGDEHGATVDGTRESRLVLDVAMRAASAITSLAPEVRVVLTRTTDDEVSLEQRAALANSLDADVFVSIHANDADVPVSTGGITTFVLNVHDPAQAQRLAARENATTTDRVSGLAMLLAGLHRESQVADSRRLAESVHAHGLAQARRTLPRLPDRGVREAGFYVLVGTRMPAILFECSFMTRPEELAALRTEPYRAQLATGVAEGVVDYLRAR